MFQDAKSFSSFSVDDIAKARAFYADVLGVNAEQTPMGLQLHLENNTIFLYPKKDHLPASFTVLNFKVDNVDQAVDALTEKGITFEKYDWGDEMKTDDKGIMRGIAAAKGPDIAWFKDPSGNVLSVLQEK